MFYWNQRALHRAEFEFAMKSQLEWYKSIVADWLVICLSLLQILLHFIAAIEIELINKLNLHQTENNIFTIRNSSFKGYPSPVKAGYKLGCGIIDNPIFRAIFRGWILENKQMFIVYVSIIFSFNVLNPLFCAIALRISIQKNRKSLLHRLHLIPGNLSYLSNRLPSFNCITIHHEFKF